MGNKIFQLNKQKMLKYQEGFIGTKVYNKQRDCYKIKNNFNQVTKVVYFNMQQKVVEFISYEYYPSKKIKTKKNILWNDFCALSYLSEKTYYPNHNVKALKEIKYNYESMCEKIEASRYRLNGNVITKEIMFKKLDGTIKKIVSYVYNHHGQLCSSPKAGRAYKFVTVYKQDRLNKMDHMIEYIYDFKGELNTKSIKEYTINENKINFKYVKPIEYQNFAQN